MPKTLITLITLIVFANNVFANTIILEQGDAVVSHDDIDGFAMTIPDDKRHGYFDSPKRIEYILTNILKIKHFINYANSNNMKFPKSINKKVESRLIDISKKNQSKAFTMDQQRDLSLLNEYIKLEEQYNYLKKQLKKSISRENVEELAKEEYLINKELYVNVESRDIRYISFLYDKDAKDDKAKQKAKAEKTLLEIKSLDFLDYIKDNLLNEVSIETSLDLNNFKYSKQHIKISSFIFEPNKTGLINKLLDFNYRFNIFYVYKINTQTIRPFEEVKKQIITNLYKSKVDRFFINLYSELTQEEVKINKEAVQSLRARYILKPKNG